MDKTAKKRELRHDRHTISLLSDHMVFSPKYRVKILIGDVAMVAEAIICKTCREMDIEIIEIAVNPDHVHIFFRYPPKHSLSYISKKIKGRSSRILKEEFPHLKDWCGEHLWAPSCFHGSSGNGWDVVEKYISAHNTYEYNSE
jgi:putative transposase